MQRGFALAKQNKTAEAIGAFREAVRIDPDLIEAHFSLGVLLARGGREGYAESTRHFLEVLRLNPRDTDARINISNLLEEEGDLEASVAEMRNAMATAPGRPDLLAMLGRKQQKAGKYADAADSFREVLKSGRELPAAHYGLGLALKYQRMPAEAAREFEAVLAAHPRDASAHFELGTVLARQERGADALAHFKEAVRLDPDLAEGWVELGQAYRRENRAGEAAEAFRQALRINPELVTALYGLARTAAERQRPEEAAELFGRIRDLKTRNAESGSAGQYNAEGVAYTEQGRLDEALASFRRAFESDPKFATAAYNVGVVLARKGATQEAAEAFRAAIRLRPSFSAAHVGLGLVLSAAGDPGAEEELRTAQTLERLAKEHAAK